jgi:hypothetical protein
MAYNISRCVVRSWNIPNQVLETIRALLSGVGIRDRDMVGSDGSVDGAGSRIELEEGYKGSRGQRSVSRLPMCNHGGELRSTTGYLGDLEIRLVSVD